MAGGGLEPDRDYTGSQAKVANLATIDVDSDHVFAFLFPEPVWAADFDEATGLLAVAQDEVGNVIYDVASMLSDDRTPKSVIPTAGVPTAVCFRYLKKRLVVVVAGQAAPKVEVFGYLEHVSNWCSVFTSV